MRILMAAAEAAPYVKVGGLADVAGSLPLALGRLGCEVELVLPGYAQIDRDKYGFADIGTIEMEYCGKPIQVALQQASPGPGVRVYLVHEGPAFDRGGVYDDPETKEGYRDNPQRFAFFSRVVAELAAIRQPDVVHVHDSHTGLVPALMRFVLHSRFERRVPVVMTVHNLAYQTPCPKEVLFDVGFLPQQFRPMSPLEFHGNANFLKTGIHTADAITTVSERYAREIQTGEFGCGLEGLLQYRSCDLFGILNGIDTDVWNPATDPLIPANYTADDLSGKRACREALLSAAGLRASENTPVIGMVGRLTEQKGLEIFAEAIPALLAADVRFAILGSGQDKYHHMLSEIQRVRPDKFAVYHGFNNELAHRIEAGSDFFLMPSMFEPCGLNQMYSMRYGTIPIVRRTGGLADTVRDQEEARGEGTGFVFDQPRGGALLRKMHSAIHTFHQPAERHAMIARGMATDFSGERSAARYLELFRSLAS